MENLNKTINELNGTQKSVLSELPQANTVENPTKLKEPDIQPSSPTEAVKAKPRKPTRYILVTLGVGAIASASYFGYHWWQYASTHQQTDNAQVAGHLHQVSSRVPGNVREVLVDDNQWVQKGQLLVRLDPKDYQSKVEQAVAATQNARRQAEAAQSSIALTADTSRGRVYQAQGDVSGAIAIISAAQAELTEARGGIPIAEAEVKLAAAGIPLTQAQVEQANANFAKEEADYNRFKALYQQGAIPQQQLYTSKAAYDVALAQKRVAIEGVEQAKARLATAKVRVGGAKARLAQAQEKVANAQAKLAASQGGLQQANASQEETTVKARQYQAAKAAVTNAEAFLKEAQLHLSYTDITAPSTGRVGRKTVEVGNRVQAGTPLLAIVDNEYWIVANFKETQLENMEPGQEVEIKLDTFPHHLFQGHVDSISPASGAQFALLPPDNATGNFTKIVQRIPVKIVFEPESVRGYETRITPGMSAEISVKVK